MEETHEYANELGKQGGKNPKKIPKFSINHERFSRTIEKNISNDAHALIGWYLKGFSLFLCLYSSSLLEHFISWQPGKGETMYIQYIQQLGCTPELFIFLQFLPSSLANSRSYYNTWGIN